MEEEIDLRPYIELLIRRWYIVVGAAVLAGLVAFGSTSLQEPVYKATALVAVTQDRLIARFDPRLDSREGPQPLKVLPELATSNSVLNELLNNLNPPLEDIRSISGLRGLLEAEPGADPSLIRLTVEYLNPVDTARVSNLWAETFIESANELFGDGDGELLTFFEDQLSRSEEELSSAEADLIEDQGVNRSSILGNQLNDLKELQKRLLADQRALGRLESSIQDLRDQIAEADGGSSPSFADQLASLILQLRVFNATVSLPLQLQFDGTSDFGDGTRDEQVILLDDLQGIVMSRLTANEVELTQLEPELLGLQEELQEAQSERNRLVLNRDVAQETYLSLARKVDEERITSDDVTRSIRLASEAVVPVNPMGTNSLTLSIIVGIFVGGTVVLIISINSWVSSYNRDEDKDKLGTAAADVNEQIN